MGDRRRDRVSRLSHRNEISHSATTTQALVAASQIITDIDRRSVAQHESWQDEAWGFYESMGEFNYGVEWFSEALSRVRLTAAKVTPGGDEPEIISKGPAADLVSHFMGGSDGQSQALKSLATQLSVPGDAYFVGREVTDAEVDYGLLMDSEVDENGQVWTVNPVNTLRRHRGRSLNFARRRDQRYRWDIQLDETVWIPLPPESLVVRIWDRNEHHPWKAISPAKPAIPIMREIDMYNRHIIASLVSRVAMNGMLLIPDEVTLPASPQYQDAVDPFVAEMLDIMMATIKNPGSPAAAVPMPVKIPSEYIEKFKHLTFATGLDAKVFEARAEAIKRLAATLNLPAEIITGMGDVNHWSSWSLTEDAIKIHISPKVEIITRALTLGYLHPMLRAMGEDTRTADGTRIIMWYDTSELTQRPDRSGSAIQLREMMIISDAATRRETGFDEADKPTTAEVEEMVLKKLAVNPQTAGPALEELTGLKLNMTPPPPGPAGGDDGGTVGDDTSPSVSDTEPNSIIPTTRNDPPPPPDEGVGDVTASARRDRIVRRTHAVRRRARIPVTRVR